MYRTQSFCVSEPDCFTSTALNYLMAAHKLYHIITYVIVNETTPFLQEPIFIGQPLLSKSQIYAHL